MKNRFSPPDKVRLRWGRHFRIIATRYPPVDLFERLNIPEHGKRALLALQARTNPRIMQQTGDLRLVRDGDMVSGPNASIVMAAFTHIGSKTRFSDGTFGIYYAAHSLETAIRETVFHRETDARERNLAADEWAMRAYIGSVDKGYYDIRGEGYEDLHDPDIRHYPVAQGFTRELRLRDGDAWGVVYNSVRHTGGACIAAFRPTAISLPIHGPHLVYVWDGSRITTVYEKSEPLVTF